jgi:F-type H+-transporting ATPase subunit delta
MAEGLAGVDRSVARRYAEAFVNVAERSGRLDEYLEELKGVAKVYEESKALARFIGSPEIDLLPKQELIDRVWGEAVGEAVIALLKLILDRERFNHLPAIVEEAERLRDERFGVMKGTVFTAHPIAASEMEAIAQAMGRWLKKQVVLERKVDPSLLGGAQVVLGSLNLDGSVRGSLERLRRHWMEMGVDGQGGGMHGDSS